MNWLITIWRRLTQPPAHRPCADESELAELFDHINRLELIMSALTDKLAALKGSIDENTAANQALIGALAATEPTADQLAELDADKAQLDANTKAAQDAVNPPAPETPATEEPAS